MSYDIFYYLGETKVGSKIFLLHIDIKMEILNGDFFVFLHIVSIKIVQSLSAMIDLNPILHVCYFYQ